MARRPSRRFGSPLARARARAAAVAAGVIPVSPPPVGTLPGALDPATNLNVFQMGYNVGGANYYSPYPLLNNWGKFADVRSNGEIGVPFAGISGVCTIKTIVGVTLDSGHPSITRLASDASTGIHRFNITADATDTVNRLMTWTGTRPTYLEVTRDGHPEKVAPEWVAGIEGRWLRNLDADATNAVPANGQADRPVPTDKVYFKDYMAVGSYMPYQDYADGIAAKMAADPGFVGLWDVLGVDLADADITARATYQRDNLPPRARIALEFGNEQPWNTTFGGARRIMLDGLRKGWYGAATAGNPQPPLTITTDLGYFNPSAPERPHPPACAAGTLVTANYDGVGFGVYEAKQTVPTGTDIGENAYWTRRTDLDAGSAGRRWRAIRLDQIIEIYRSVFGETRFEAQIVPLTMAQTTGEIIQQLVIERTFVPGGWAKVKGVGHGFYFNAEDNYALGPDGKDDGTATAAGLEASFRRRMGQLKGWITQTVIDCAAMGKVPMFYEGLTHPNDSLWRGGGSYRQAWDTLFSSEAGAALMAEFAAFCKETVPGVMMGFSLIGQDPWQLKRTWADTANKRLLGWRAGINSATPKPEFVTNPVIVGSPRIGSTVTSSKVRVKNGIITRVRFFLDGVEVSAAPLAKAGQLVMKVLAQGLGGSTEFVTEPVAVTATPPGFRFWRFTPKKAGGQYGNTPDGQFYRVGTEETTAIGPDGPLSKTGWSATTESGTGGNDAGHAVDGDYGTYYLTNPQAFVNAGRFVVDVGENNAIKPVSWDIRYVGVAPDLSINSCIIEASNDQAVWEKVADVPIDGLAYVNGVANVPLVYPS